MQQATTIVITGPESTGKTTLAAQLADHFNTAWVPEFARQYINQLNRPYTENDLLEIARGQMEQENRTLLSAKKPFFLDTSLEVIKIWADYKYGRCHPWIDAQIEKRKHDFYLLCQPDIPWQPDSQREHPYEREKIFEHYVQELTRQNANFVSVSGLEATRLTNAIQHVKPYLHIPRSTNHAQ